MHKERKRIGYLTFGRDDFSYGLALCLSELKDHDLFRVTPKTAKLCDWLLFSCFWWEHIYCVADFLRSAAIEKTNATRPRIVIGGFNTINPVPFMAYADFVVVGDGEGCLSAIIDRDELPPNILTEHSQSVDYGVSKLKAFRYETNGISRIEIARGCKASCTFCAVSWLKPYRELSAKEIRSVLVSTKCARVSLFAPEPTMHSDDIKLTTICHNYGKQRIDSDVRLDRLHLRSDSVPRVGIEGLSEKLRKSVHKPYSSEKIINAVRQAISDGRKGLFMYLILDLPGENDDDWEEFKELCESIGRLPGANKFVLKPSPSVFLPTPHTPMANCKIHWACDYHEKWEKFFGRGDDRNWQVIMAERSRVFSPAMRLLSMISTRGGPEFSQLEKEASATKKISISSGRPIVKDLSGLLAIVKNFGGIERYCGEQSSGPWNIVRISRDRQKGNYTVVDFGEMRADDHAENLDLCGKLEGSAGFPFTSEVTA